MRQADSLLRSVSDLRRPPILAYILPGQNVARMNWKLQIAVDRRSYSSRTGVLRR